MYRSTRILILSICLLATGGMASFAQEVSPGPAVPSVTPLAGDPAPWPSTELSGAAAITAGDDRFVVVGSVDDERETRATAWTSTDGLTWIEAPKGPELRGARMRHVTAFGGGFVAMGEEASDTPGEPYGTRVVAWHSPDGLTWQRARVERPRARGLQTGVQAIAVGPAGLLAYADYFGQDLGQQRLWRSDDGLAWEVASFPEADNVLFSSLSGFPGGYLLTGVGACMEGECPVEPLAPGESGPLWRSADGVTWEETAGPANGWAVDAAADDDGTVVAISSPPDVPRIWVTSDLQSWRVAWVEPEAAASARAADPPRDGTRLTRVDWDGAQFVAIGVFESGEDRSGLTLVSADAMRWVELNGPDGIPGTDPDTYLAGTASLGGITLALGDADGRTLAWVADLALIEEQDETPAA